MRLRAAGQAVAVGVRGQADPEFCIPVSDPILEYHKRPWSLTHPAQPMLETRVTEARGLDTRVPCRILDVIGGEGTGAQV